MNKIKTNLEKIYFATKFLDGVNQPKTLKERARFFSRELYLNLATRFNTNIQESFLRCIYCHYVFNDQINQFEKHIINLKKTGQFINTERLLRMLTGKETIKGRYYHLSFDDGFKNNLLNAIPILEKYNIPALFFIPTSIINAKYSVVKDYCIETTKYKNAIEMLTWDDIKLMIDKGFEIGSHTRNHINLNNISSDRNLMEKEILGSKLDIEKELKIKCDYISWPFGKITDIDSNSINFIKGSDYKACFGAFRGSVIKNNTDIFKIPRHHFEAHWPENHVNYFARGNKENN